MKKLLFIGLLFLLASCSSYQIKVEHLDGNVDTVYSQKSEIKILPDNRLTDRCGCSQISFNVKKATILKKVETKSNTDYKKVWYFFFIIITITGVFIFYFNTKESIMKKILIFIFFGVIIVTSFKIGLVLIEYLPPLVESFFK